MKKLILFLSLFFFTATVNVFAQEEAKQEYVTDLDAEKLIDKYIYKVESKISEIYDGPAKEYYAITVRAYKVSAVIWSFSGLLLMCPLIVFAVIFFRMPEYDRDDNMPGWPIFGMVALIGTLILFINIETFYNADYYAIRDIIKSIR